MNLNLIFELNNSNFHQANTPLIEGLLLKSEKVVNCDCLSPKEFCKNRTGNNPANINWIQFKRITENFNACQNKIINLIPVLLFRASPPPPPGLTFSYSLA